MSNSYECSINKNLGYYLKEDKLEKYKSRSTNTLCGPLGLGLHSAELLLPQRKLRWTEQLNSKEVSLSLGEALEYCERANVNPVIKKGKKEDPGNYRPVSLTSVHGKVVQQLILETVSKHMKNGKGLAMRC